MLRRFILYVRRKPKHVRDSYAFATAGVVTSIIAVVWIWNWPSMIENRREGSVGAEDTAPLSSFLDRAKDQVAAARDTADLESLAEVVPADGAASTSAQSIVDAVSGGEIAVSTATPPIIATITTSTTAVATSSESSE